MQREKTMKICFLKNRTFLDGFKTFYMKSISLLPVTTILFLCSITLSAQTKMILSMDGKQSDLFGYVLDEPSGNSREITMFGPLQNAAQSFEFGLEAGKLLPAVNLTITDAVTGTTAIHLTNLTVLAVKQFISTYTNGSFAISPGGNVNTEVKCRFEKIEIKSGNNTEQKSVKENSALSKFVDRWELVPNEGLKGMTGRIVVKMPAPSRVLMKIYKTGDMKQSDTWHESNFANKDNMASGNYLPGYYDIAIWNERLDSIRVESGNDTRLKVGVLDVNLKGTWRILDENKKELYHLSLHEKVLLPVGNYFVATGIIEQPVTVKDGEIVRF